MKNIFSSEKLDIKNLNEVIKSGKKILTVFFILLVVVGIYAVTLIFKEWRILPFLFLILKILSPFFIGLVIAWLLDPCVKFLKKKGINRVVGTCIVYLGLIIILYLMVTAIFPSFLNQMNDFIKTLPSVFDEIIVWSNKAIDSFKNISFIDTAAVKKDVVSSINGFVGSLTTDIPKTMVSFITSLFSSLSTFALGLMIGFYLLFDFDNVGKALLSILPDKVEKDARELFDEANDSLFNYIKGTLLTSLIIFAVSSLVFTIVGIKAPLLFGLICAITNIIPYVGPYIGAVPVALVAFTQSVATGIITVIAIVVIQFIEGNIIHPIVMSKTMKLHPVTILIGLLFFGHFFGILGMIIGTPLVAIIKSIAVFIKKKIDSYEAKSKQTE